jgi:hypothetical protein
MPYNVKLQPQLIVNKMGLCFYISENRRQLADIEQKNQILDFEFSKKLLNLEHPKASNQHRASSIQDRVSRVVTS